MAWRSSSRNYITGSGSLVLNKPSGTVNTDLLLLAITGFFPGYTLPSGFTQIGSDLDIGSPDGQRLSVYYKVAGGSEPSTYTVTVNNGSEPTATLQTFSGRDTTSPIYAYATSTNTSNNSSPITLSLTGVTAGANDDIFIVYAGDTTQSSDRWSGAPPSGYTEIEDYAPQDWAGIYAHMKAGVSAGATGTLQPTLTRTVGSGGAGWLGFVIALKAAAGAGNTYNESATESVTLSDASSNTLTLAAAITESITSSESSSATGVLTRNITEAITATESQAASLSVPASITESISTADSPSARLTAAAAITEALSLSDSSSSSLGGNIYGVSITESISNAETSNAALIAVGAITEAITLNHTQTASALFAAQINEAITANATHGATQVLPAAISEAAALVDSPNAGLTRLSTITEAVTATESSSSVSAQVYNASITESINLTVQADVSLIKKLAKRVIGGAISLRESVGSLIRRNIGSDLTERDE